jgi:hypothetical protein
VGSSDADDAEDVSEEACSMPMPESPLAVEASQHDAEEAKVALDDEAETGATDSRSRLIQG